MSRTVAYIPGTGNLDTVLRSLVNAHPNFVDITTPATSGTELAVRHDLGRIPKGCIVVKGDPDDHTSGGTVPVGTVLDFCAAAVPTGYLECDGSAVSRTTYADLFAAIGTTFGVGDGSTTFNLPDFRRRVAMGKGGTAVSGPANTLGANGGAETHTLATAEIPAHTHTVNDPGHGHDGDVYASGTTRSAIGGITGATKTTVTDVVNSKVTGITIANAGGGGAHNNVQPSLVVTKIIRYVAGNGTTVDLTSSTAWDDKNAYLKFMATGRALTLAFF